MHHAASDLYDGGDRIYPTDTLPTLGLNLTQSLVPDIAYYYLQNTLGLSEETMWKITLEAGSVLGMTPRNLEKKVSLLRRTMNLSDEDVRVILAKQPAVLHYSAERNLGSTIIFLVRALDLSKSELRILVLDSPSILGYSLSNLSRKLSFFVNTLGYVDDDNYFEGMDRVRNLLVGTPKLLLSAVDTGLEPRFQFLHNEIEFSIEELQTLYEKNPKLLMYSLDENMREKIVFFFILRLRIRPENVRKLLLSFPQVMDYNLENHLKPIADYYVSDVRFSATEFGSIVTRFPRLFSYSLFKIKHVTGFLRFELGLDATQVKRVIFQAPQIVGLNTEGNLQKKLDLLQTRLSLTRQELGLVLSKMPTLMNLGIDNNLLPKLEYLEKVANDTNHSGDVNLVKRMVLKQPTLLGYSLENRIRPRMEKILSAGLSADKVTVGISMAENKFQDWLASSQLRKQRKVDVQKNLQNASRSKMTYLEELLDMNETEVRTILSTMPGLKYVRSNKMFERKVTYFNAELQNVTSATKAILMGRPSLLQCSIKQGWEPRMQQIRAVGTDDLQKVTALFLISDDEFQAWTLKKKYTETIDFLRTSTPTPSSVQFSEDDLDSFLLQVAGVSISDANLKESVKFLLSLSGGSLDGINTIALDNPLLLLSTQALRERMMIRETLCRKVKQYWDFDEMATLVMSEIEFEYQLSLCDAKMLLHKKLNFTRKELDFVVSQQVRKDFPIDLAAKLDYLMSRDVSVDIEIAILTKPKLLSHTIEKLRSTPRALLRRSKLNAKLIYEEETKEMLLAFGFSSIDVTNIVSGSRILGMRHPQMILKPKLELLLSTWKKEDIITHASAKPLLFDKSLAELELLVKKGVPSSKTKNKASLGASNTNQMEEIKAELNLTEAEFELMFPKRQLGRDVMPTWQYLSTQVDSEDLKEALLSEPRILSLSLSKRIKPRMELLLERGCDPADIFSIALLSQKKAEEFCLQCYFCREFELSQKQADRLLRKVLVDKQSRCCLQQKVEYLLPNAFGDSRKKIKDAMLKNPLMLKQALDQTIKPRVEVLQLLRSAGFNVTEHGPLLSMRNSEFTNGLLLYKSWSPEQTVDKPLTALPTNIHAAAVKELMPSSLAISFSDDDNRDVATVVQWR